MFTALKRKLFGGETRIRPGTAVCPAGKLPGPTDADVADLKKRGNALLGKNDAEGAAQCYRQALVLAPNHVGILVSLGYALSELQLYEQARSNLEKAIQLDPKRADASYLMAIVHRSEGNTDQAIETFRATLLLKPGLIECRLDLVRLLFERGDVAAAKAVLNAGIAIEPTAADLHYYLGKVHQQAGQLDKAALSFECAIANAANHDEARRALGAVREAQGNLEAALRAYRSANAPLPEDAAHYLQLGSAFHRQGLFEPAIESFGLAASLQPALWEAHANLGAALHAQERVADAVSSYERAIALRPEIAQSHFRLGSALQDLRQMEPAMQAYRQAVALDPGLAEAHCNLGTSLQAQGRLDEALTSYQAAISIRADYAEAHSNAGTVLQGQGDLPAAIRSYHAAISIRPGFVECHQNLGMALQAQGKLAEAVQRYETAIQLQPNFAPAHISMGTAYFELGEYDAATACYEIAKTIDEGAIDVHINLSQLLHTQGKLGAARVSLLKALSIDPNSAQAHSNLGAVFQEMGEHNAAIDSFRRALVLQPDFADAHNNLLFTLNYHPDKSAEDIFAEYREHDERAVSTFRSTWPEHDNARDPTKRLKLGYVSPDFRRHAVCHFLEPLLAHHDKRQVEIFAYAQVAVEDSVSQRYRGYVDHWISTVGMTDEALAERIRRDGIDILVDLAGHTAKNRLGAFARKPAPVSMSWLGFGYTTGLSAIDYLLTDPVSAPEGSEDLFSEKPWRLAMPGYVYRPAEGMGAVSALPAQQRGFVTFGTLTRSVRINHRSVHVWSRILRRVPMARLVVDSGNFQDPGTRAALLKKFAAHGIGPERLEVGFHSPPWDVLRGIDIGLDCFPHNSGTTLFESLYMGLPFVTLAGRPSVGRLGSSILHSVGYPEWIAGSEDEYVDVAVSLAADLPRLTALRDGLRARMRASALMDEPGFARKVEAAYREMFSRWAAVAAR